MLTTSLCVYARETFEQALFNLVRNAEGRQPGKSRKLFLDIEGHRDDQGRFDADMLELQQNFLTDILGKHLPEICAPLHQMTDPDSQDNDLRSG